MGKSLLSILNTEAQLIEKIDDALNAADLFQRRYDKIRSIPIDCEAKEADLAQYAGIISEYRNEAEEYKRQLDAVREDLMAYLAILFS